MNTKDLKKAAKKSGNAEPSEPPELIVAPAGRREELVEEIRIMRAGLYKSGVKSFKPDSPEEAAWTKLNDELRGIDERIEAARQRVRAQAEKREAAKLAATAAQKIEAAVEAAEGVVND